MALDLVKHKIYTFVVEYVDLRHLSLKLTNSLAIFRLKKPLKTSTRLVGHDIWTRDLPNASLVRYHGATLLGDNTIDNSYNIKTVNSSYKRSYDSMNF